MSIAAKLGIEEKYGDCQTCDRKDTLVKRWGEKDEGGRRKFLCAECAEKDDQIFKVMQERMLFGRP